MLVTKLKAYLERLYSDKNQSKTVLINGKIGIGKTYNIRTFVSSSNPNVIYISLFGITSLNDLLVKLSESLGSEYISNINGNLSIVVSLIERPYNNAVIILDDLERTVSTVDYVSLFGVIDSLKHVGFKVVCIVSEENVDGESRITDFKKYKEKTFDSCVGVIPDYKCFEEIAQDDKLIFQIEQLEKLCGNWRFVQKAENSIKELDSALITLKKPLFFIEIGIDRTMMFRCVLDAIRCIFSTNDKIPSFPDETSFSKINYENDVDALGRYEANELYKIFKEGENASLKDMVRQLIPTIENDSWEEFVLSFYPKKEDEIVEEFPFSQEPFYLTDEGKKLYLKSFFENLHRFNFARVSQEKILAGVLSYLLDLIDDDGISLILNHIENTMSPSEIDGLAEQLFTFAETTNDKLKKIQDGLENASCNKKNDEIKNIYRSSLESRDYKTLTNQLYLKEFAPLGQKNDILSLIEPYDFGLPELWNGINRESWQYCHEVAKFVVGTDYQEKFVNCLRKQCAGSKSKSLRQRCNTLTHQYGLSDVDFMTIEYVEKESVEISLESKCKKEILDKIIESAKCVGCIINASGLYKISETINIIGFLDTFKTSDLLVGFDMFEYTNSGDFRFGTADERIVLKCVDLGNKEFIFKPKNLWIFISDLNDDSTPYLIFESDDDIELRESRKASIRRDIYQNDFDYIESVYYSAAKREIFDISEVDNIINDYYQGKGNDIILRKYFLNRKYFAVMDFLDLRADMDSAKLVTSIKNMSEEAFTSLMQKLNKK